MKQPKNTDADKSGSAEDQKKKRLAEALRRNLRQRKKASSASSRPDGQPPDKH